MCVHMCVCAHEGERENGNFCQYCLTFNIHGEQNMNCFSKDVPCQAMLEHETKLKINNANPVYI